MEKGFFICIILFSSLLYAKEEDGAWDAQAELGTIINAGNSSSSNFNGKLLLEYETIKWLDKFHIESQIGNNEGERTEERYAGGAELRYRFANKVYLFVNVDASKQYFKPYDFVSSETLGVGRRFLDTAKVTFDAQIGPGGRHSVDTDSDITIDEMILLLNAGLSWKVTDSATLKEDVQAKSGQSNNYVKSALSVQTKFVGHLGMRFAYTVEYNSTLPPDGKKTKHFDHTTSITMVYDF